MSEILELEKLLVAENIAYERQDFLGGTGIQIKVESIEISFAQNLGTKNMLECFVWKNNGTITNCPQILFKEDFRGVLKIIKLLGGEKR